VVKIWLRFEIAKVARCGDGSEVRKGKVLAKCAYRNNSLDCLYAKNINVIGEYDGVGVKFTTI
jgi:hypothetical protein